MASENGHDKVVELLLKDTRVKPSANDNYAIQMASEKGHDKVVELLLKDKKRVNPAVDDNFAIRIAAAKGLIKVVELLLKDKRVNPEYAINWASVNGQDKVVELLLKNTRVNPDNRTIKEASDYGHDKVVELLLNKVTNEQIKAYVRLNSDFRTFYDELLPIEKGYIETYTNECAPMQAVVRNTFQCDKTDKPKKDVKKIISELQSLFLKVPPLSQPVVVWRGIKGDNSVFIDKYQVGNTFSEDAFTSTSLNREVALNFQGDNKCCLLKINVPVGSKCLWIMDKKITNKYGGEEELVLPMGASFRVISDHVERINDSNKRILTLEMSFSKPKRAHTISKYVNEKSPTPSVARSSKKRRVV